jgi:NADH-quinone oxidoreductase subunit C
MGDDVVDEEIDAGAEEGSDDAGPAHELRHGAIVTESRGDTVLHASVEEYLEVASALRDEGFDQLTDLTAVDYLTYSAPRSLPTGVTAERFEVVFAVLSYTTRERVRVRVQVSADAAVVPSLFDLWPGSEALEREVFDMFGIEFDDHPDMSRILMPEDWIGHPLRKDYAIGEIPVQFKAASNIR